MSHAFPNGLGGSAGNLASEDGHSLGQYGSSDLAQPRSGSVDGLAAMFAEQARRSAGASALQQPDLGANGPNQQMWQPQLHQPTGFPQGGIGFGGSDYDNFLASAGLGVKSQQQQQQQQRLPPQQQQGNMGQLLRGNSELFAQLHQGQGLQQHLPQNGGMLQQQQQQHHPGLTNIQAMLAGMSRTPSNGQLGPLQQ